jgi:hypothetical protein
MLPIYLIGRNSSSVRDKIGTIEDLTVVVRGDVINMAQHTTAVVMCPNSSQELDRIWEAVKKIDDLQDKPTFVIMTRNLWIPGGICPQNIFFVKDVKNEFVKRVKEVLLEEERSTQRQDLERDEDVQQSHQDPKNSSPTPLVRFSFWSHFTRWREKIRKNGPIIPRRRIGNYP